MNAAGHAVVALAALVSLSACGLRTGAIREYAAAGGVPCRPSDVQPTGTDEMGLNSQRFEVLCRGDLYQCAKTGGFLGRDSPYRCSMIERGRQRRPEDVARVERPKAMDEPAEPRGLEDKSTGRRVISPESERR